MRIQVLGCGDAFGSGGRFNTCFCLTTSADRRVVVDFGATAMVAFRQQDLAPESIDAIVLTHLHGDHFGGLPFLLLYLQFEARRARSLTILGPPETAARVEALTRAMFGAWPEWRFPLRFETLTPGTTAPLAGLAVEAFPVVHGSADARALRLRDGDSVFAYSGDTAWTDVLVEVARGADLFVMECYAPAPGCPTHTDWQTLAPHLADLDARRVALTHLNQSMLDHPDPPGIEVLRDGLCFDI